MEAVHFRICSRNLESLCFGQKEAIELCRRLPRVVAERKFEGDMEWAGRQRLHLGNDESLARFNITGPKRLN